MGSAALTLFSLSIILFQISCQKDSNAQSGNSSYTLPPATTSTLGGVIVGNGLSVTSNGTISVTASGVAQQNKILYIKEFHSADDYCEIWTANFDGTNAHKINITIPTGMYIDAETGVHISPDRQLMFLSMYNPTTNIENIYSCKLDGTNLTKVVDGTGAIGQYMGDAY